MKLISTSKKSEEIVIHNLFAVKEGNALILKKGG
jgi:hypothetical protein